MNNKYSNVRTLYFDPSVAVGVGKTAEVNLMVNDFLKPVTEFSAEFTYDSTILMIEKVEINKEVFDKMIVNNVDQFAGKIIIKASSSSPAASLKKGEQKLATITMRGIKKGEFSFKGNGVREFGISVK